jgi:hypothetical protein
MTLNVKSFTSQSPSWNEQMGLEQFLELPMERTIANTTGFLETPIGVLQCIPRGIYIVHRTILHLFTHLPGQD